MLKLSHEIKRWTMIEPFIIANQRYDYIDVVIVTLRDHQGNIGRAETAGVDYHGETANSICADLDKVKSRVEEGITLDTLQSLLPAGGARNGLDCALWDLTCAQSGQDIWQATGVCPLKTTATVYTIGIVGLEHASELARQHTAYASIKIKAGADGSLSTIEAVRAICPDAAIIVDANQSWSPELFGQITPRLSELNIAVLEQPFPVEEDDILRDYNGPLKLAADESLQSSIDIKSLHGKYDVVNIKLDKAGGLSEALKVAHQAKHEGFGCMVGNMCGSSLAMAPALVLAQLCDYIDLDGPLLQSEDCTPALEYKQGIITVPKTSGLWAGL